MQPNAIRAKRCAEKIARYGDDMAESNLIDLLADAMHWCDHTGSDFHITASSALNRAVFAPMPSARTSKATMLKPGILRKVRREYRKSFRRLSICLFVKQVKGRSRDWASDWNY